MLLLGFILCGILCAFWTCLAIFFPMLGNFSTIIYSNIFLDSFSSSSGTLISQKLVWLTLPQGSLRLSSYLCIFSLYSALWQLFLPSWLPSYLFFFLLQLFQCIFHFSYCVVHNCLFFSSTSLLYISCIFSIHGSILFLRS